MNILIYDIETAPNLGYIWGKYEQNVLEYEQEWYLLSFAYKWLGDRSVKVEGLPDYKIYKREPENDIELVKKLWELFDKADIIIAHNGDAFDEKKVNARFLYHGLTPPSPYKTIDTKKAAKRAFKLNSNKLDDIGKYLNVGRKMDTGGWELWRDCLRGEKSAWRKMKTYNKFDVVLLEKVYLKLLPWITNHPNMNVMSDSPMACPNCTSHNLQKRGFGMTGMTKHQRYQCMDCGRWSRGKNEKKVVDVR